MEGRTVWSVRGKGGLIHNNGPSGIGSLLSSSSMQMILGLSNVSHVKDA